MDGTSKMLVGTAVVVFVLLVCAVACMGAVYARLQSGAPDAGSGALGPARRRPRVVVVNLARRTDRKATMAKKLAAVGIHFAEFVPAVDGSALELTPQLEQLFENWRGKKRGEMGCALSHLRLWQELAAEEDPAALLAVLEDDVTFRPEFDWRRDLATSAPDVMRFLGFTSKGSNPSRVEKRVAPMQWDAYRGGTFGYVLGRPVARLLVSHVRLNGISRPIDGELRHLEVAAEHVGTVESLSAHLIPGKVDSDIQFTK